MENSNNNQNRNMSGNESENTISIRDIVFMVLDNWYWFVISVVACLVIAAFVYKAQPKSYTASGTVLVRDNDKKNVASQNMDAILNNMGMGNTDLSLANEIYMMRSSALMCQVIDRLDLNYTCSRRDLFKKISYFGNAPVKLSVYEKSESHVMNLNLTVTPKTHDTYQVESKHFHLKKLAKYGEPVELDDTLLIKVDKTPHYSSEFQGVKLHMGVSEVLPMARRLVKNLSVTRVDKMASILAISYKDENSDRAKQIVDTLIAVYNDDAIDDKNKVAQKTEKFISERIALISGELGSVDSQVEQLKKSSQLPELSSASSILQQTSTRYTDQVVQLEAELSILRDIKNSISDPLNKEELIPANLGTSDPGVQS